MTWSNIHVLFLVNLITVLTPCTLKSYFYHILFVGRVRVSRNQLWHAKWRWQNCIQIKPQNCLLAGSYRWLLASPWRSISLKVIPVPTWYYTATCIICMYTSQNKTIFEFGSTLEFKFFSSRIAGFFLLQTFLVTGLLKIFNLLCFISDSIAVL